MIARFQKSMSPLALAVALSIGVGAGTLALSAPAFAQVAVSELHPSAPSRYVVVKGDTLWDISGRFLRSPTKWPLIWRMNQSHIKNPHLIYPGDVIYLKREGGMAYLSLSKGEERGEIRLSPGVRMEDSVDQSISTVSSKIIRPFLTKPLIVDVEQFSTAPRIVANEDGHLNVGAGSKTYVTGLEDGGPNTFAVYRQGPVLVDPETKEVMAVEAIYLGRVRVLRHGEPALMQVLEANQELGRGDRLVPVPERVEFSSPLADAPPGLNARIIKVYDNQSASMPQGSSNSVRNYDREGGPLSIVILNKGEQDGLDAGQVVRLDTLGKVVGRTSPIGYTNGKKSEPLIQLPDEKNGLAVVFKSFDRIAYALVMKASRPVMAGDPVKAVDD